MYGKDYFMSFILMGTHVCTSEHAHAHTPIPITLVIWKNRKIHSFISNFYLNRIKVCEVFT